MPLIKPVGSILLILTFLPFTASATTINWAKSLDAQTGFFLDINSSSAQATAQPASLLGEPDLAAERVVFDSSTSATFSDFSDVTTYDPLNFMEKTRLGANTLANGDFILLDQNYQKVSGVEYSSYTFSDGTNTRVYNHSGINASLGGALLHNTYMSRDNFKDLFTSSDDDYNQWIGVLVLDLDLLGINSNSAAFSVNITGGGSQTVCGTHCPDIIGLGLLNTVAPTTAMSPVPAPPAIALFLVGLVSMTAGRIRMKLRD